MNPSRQSSQHPTGDRHGLNHDANTDEIIRFVRGCQMLQREPTDIGLRKKAVLPGIGQKTYNQDEARRNSLEEDNSSVDAAYESDPENNIDIAIFDNKTSSHINQGPWTRSRDVHSTERIIHHKHNPPRKLRAERKRRLTADVRILPPIDNFDLPDRPEAPAPIRERPRGSRTISPSVGRDNSRPARPSSARPQTRHARRMELIREYSMIPKELPPKTNSPVPKHFSGNYD